MLDAKVDASSAEGVAESRQSAAVDASPSVFLAVGLLPRVSQSRIAAGVALFLKDFVDATKVPFLEDIFNSSPFIDFFEWRRDRGEDPWSACPPSYAVNLNKGRAHATAGRQPGVGSSKLALAINVIDDPAAHLHECLAIGQSVSLPWNIGNPLDDDLDYALRRSLCADDLRRARMLTRIALRALKQRCDALDSSLREAQPPSVRIVAGGMSLGFMAALAFPCCWPDQEIVRDFIRGFDIVGEC